MTPNVSDPKRGVSQADVYQLMAYSRLYQCDSVMLLYPHHAGLPSAGGLQSSHRIVSSEADRLHTATIDLALDQGAAMAALRNACLLEEC